jgi:hypothetical protein
LVGLRIPPTEIADIDAWIASQPDPKPDRPEAIRQIVRQALATKPAGTPATVSGRRLAEPGSLLKKR